MNAPSPESLYSPSPDPSSTYNSPRVFSAILPNALPEPTYTPPDPTKKSHARKQPRGHVPRPRNAFILFRCDFVRQKKVPKDVENDHRNISRIVGRIWREMSDAEKAPWVEMAEHEKVTHNLIYPGYRYSPHVGGVVGAAPRSRKKRGDEGFAGEDLLALARNKAVEAPPRRSSSCPPPGAAPVSPVRDGYDVGVGASLTTRDDLARRPSRVIMYQSTAPISSAFTQPLLGAGPEPNFTYPWARGRRGPPLTSGPYSVAPPVDAPGWDAAPPQPQQWAHFDAGGYHLQAPLDLNSHVSLLLHAGDAVLTPPANDGQEFSFSEFTRELGVPVHPMPPLSPFFTDPFTPGHASSSSLRPPSPTMSPFSPLQSSHHSPETPRDAFGYEERRFQDFPRELFSPYPYVYSHDLGIGRLSLDDHPSLIQLHNLQELANASGDHDKTREKGDEEHSST